MSKVLVTGGCGYIGSHAIVDLIEKGYDVISVDNYLNSSPDTMAQIEKITSKKVKNYAIDICDLKELEQIFRKEDIKSIIHFAALKAVGESVNKPLKYYRNNISGIINLLDCSIKHKVKHFIFSSSCTVYGQSKELPVTEQTEQQTAESPYGYSKQVCERIIIDSLKDKDMNAILLRYFNPAGAHESNLIGESPINPPLNLVPIITEVAIGKRQSLTVFGDDYDTKDGSCIRDYIHVMDLADAHTKSLKWLESNRLGNGQYETFNLGTGEGVSVIEAIHAFEKVSNEKLNYNIGARRSGDVTAIYANYTKANELLNWTPKRGIYEIMQSAWNWEQKRSTV